MPIPRRIASLLFFLLAALPLIAGEIHPVAPPGAGPMPYISSPVSVAFGPEGGIAVWRIGAHAIWGVALDAQGRAVGPARQIVNTHPVTVEGPSVVWAHGSFRLWWRDGYPRLTHTALLGSDGTAGALRTLDSGMSPPQAWNETLGLAFSSSESDVTARFVDRDLDLVRSEPLSDVGAMYGLEALVLEDGSFAVVTIGWSGLYLTRFSAEGEREAPPLLIEPSVGTTATAYRPLSLAAATDGDSVLVVWSAGAHGELPDLKKVIVRRNDAIAANETLVSNQWQMIAAEGAEWAGGVYTVALRAGRLAGFGDDDVDLYALRIREDGGIVEPLTPLLVRPGIEAAVTMATSGASHLFFFHQGDYGMEEVFLVSIPVDGPLTRPDVTAVDARISDSVGWQTGSVAASDGVGWLVAWVERTATNEQIRSAPLGADGAPAGPPTTLASVFRWIGSPVVAFNGIDFIVAWTEGPAVLAKRIRRDGTPVDEHPLVVAGDAGGHGLSIAAKDGLALLVWASGGEIRGAFLNSGGGPTPHFAVSPVPPEEPDVWISQEGAIVTAGAGGFLLAWRERRTSFCVGIPCPTDTAAQARLVSRDGSDLSPVVTFEESSPVSAASAGGTHLVTFGSGRAAVIDGSTGEASEPMPLFGSVDGGARAFAADGEYLVAFRSNASPRPLVRRIHADGSLGTLHALDAFTLPAAVSEAGALLAVGAAPLLPPPFIGATAIQAQVAIPSEPVHPAVRRRTAGR